MGPGGAQREGENKGMRASVDLGLLGDQRNAIRTNEPGIPIPGASSQPSPIHHQLSKRWSPVRFSKNERHAHSPLLPLQGLERPSRRSCFPGSPVETPVAVTAVVGLCVFRAWPPSAPSRPLHSSSACPRVIKCRASLMPPKINAVISVSKHPPSCAALKTPC